jgi:hypothetical protein
MARWLSPSFAYPRYALLYLGAIVAAIGLGFTHHYRLMTVIVVLMLIAVILGWILPWPKDAESPTTGDKKD